MTSVNSLRALKHLGLALGSVVLLTHLARAQNGSWTNVNGGSWAVSANWSNSVVAGGSGNTADFSELTLGAARTVTLDGAQTIGNLIFGDVGNTYGWSLNTGSGGPLTLAVSSGSPTITVEGQSTSIGLALAGTQGLTKAGNGTLVLSLSNSYSGLTIINQGAVGVSNLTGAFGSGSANPVNLNGGEILALFPSPTLTTTWPINVDTNGGLIELLPPGGSGRWAFGANTLTGSGTLHLLSPTTRFQLSDQSGSGFAGKWILDGSNRAPSFNNGFDILGNFGDNAFGAEPATFTPDAITFINNGGLQMGYAASHAGSATRGITIGPGGGSFVIGLGGTVQVDGQISGTTGDPVTFEGNSTLSGVQLNSSGNTYNGHTVILTYSASVGNTYLRMGTNDAIPNGPGMGLVDFMGSGTVVATLDLNGFDETINGFGVSSSSSVVDDMTGGGASTLTVGSGDTTSSFAGIIKNTTGSNNLVKIGAGALTLSGANTYSGSTAVNGGELVISTAQQGGGSYSVADGATLGVNVLSTSTNSLPMSDLTLGATTGAALVFNFNGNPSASLPPVTASNLTANAVTLSVNFGGGVTVGQFPLIQYPAGVIGGAGFSAFTFVPPSGMTATLTNNTASNWIGVNVTLAPTIGVTLTSSVNPSVLGQPVVLTATVTNSSGAPSGTVTFKNGTVTLGSATLNGSGVAALTNSFSTISTNSITAVFSGFSSLPVSQVVNPGLATWSGVKNNVWDINTTTNWLTLGLPTTYYDGDQVQFDDTATGSTALTLAVTVKPTGVTFTNNGKNYSLGGAGAISGAASLTKSGTGALTLSNVNAYTGDTMVSNGVLTFSGAGSSTGGGVPGALFVGGGSGPAILNMNGAGSLFFATEAAVGGMTGDTNDTGSGAINQTAGTINLNYTSFGGQVITYPLELGAGGSNAYGYYNLSGGTLNLTLSGAGIRVGALGQGVLVQTGGILNNINSSSGYLDVGAYSGSAGNGGNGVATFTGGSATMANTIRLGVQPGGIGVVNIGTEAGGTATVMGASVQLLTGNTASNAVLNLDSGLLQLTGSISKNHGNGVGTDLLSLNGGTLQAAANNLTLIGNSLDNVALFNGGVTIDTQNYNETENVSLQPAGGNGIYPAGGALSIASGGGSNYIGAPLVTINGGSGSEATAIANVSNGVVTGVTLTCPGINYVAGDILSFAFAGGGTATPAGTFNYTLKADDVAPNSSGGLTKMGAGTLILNGGSAYTNNTQVKNGTLEVDGSMAGPIIVSGGTLDGGGSIASPVTVQSGGALACGSAGNIGQLYIYSALSLSGTASLRIQMTGGTPYGDYAQGMTSVTYGGTLTVTNVTSDGTPFAAGNTFTLFYASAYSGSFSVINLPLLGGGLAWSIKNLAVNGSIQVVGGVSTTPPTVTHAVSAGMLNLAWPTDHTGWRLLVQTNNLAGGLSLNVIDWGTVPDSALTNQVSVPIQATQPAEFYRLVYP